MARRLFALSSVFALVAGAHTPAAAPPRDALLVPASWLAQHLTDPNLVLLHVGAKADYDTAHIPGARYVTLADISVSDRSATGLNLEMPPVDDLRQRLATLGISDNSRIIVYYAKAPITSATRVVFTLDYAGLGGATSLLDGGLEAWARDGRATTSEIPHAAAGTLGPLKTKPLVVDAAFVNAHLKTPSFAVVDGRATTYYDGTQTGGSPDNPHRTGHIAGAHSVPFTSITDDKGVLRSTDELEAIFAKAGVQPGDTIVGYCHIGQQATAMLFGARVLGHPVLLYDGLFEDWSRHAEYPVDNPKKGGGR